MTIEYYFIITYQNPRHQQNYVETPEPLGYLQMKYHLNLSLLSLGNLVKPGNNILILVFNL